MLGLFLRHLYYMIYKIVYISFFLMFLLSFSSGCSSEEKIFQIRILEFQEVMKVRMMEIRKPIRFLLSCVHHTTLTSLKSRFCIRASLTVALILNIGRILKTTSLQPGLSFRKCRNTRWKAGIENQVLQA